MSPLGASRRFVCDASTWSLLELERTYNAAQQTEQIKRLGLLIGWTQSDRDAQAHHGIR